MGGWIRLGFWLNIVVVVAVVVVGNAMVRVLLDGYVVGGSEFGRFFVG